MKTDKLELYEDRRDTATSMNTKEYKALKREMVANLFEYDDGFIVAYFYEGYEKFIEYIGQLNKRNLNTIPIETIKLINYVNAIDKNSIRFMMEQL